MGDNWLTQFNPATFTNKSQQDVVKCENRNHYFSFDTLYIIVCPTKINTHMHTQNYILCVVIPVPEEAPYTGEKGGVSPGQGKEPFKKAIAGGHHLQETLPPSQNISCEHSGQQGPMINSMIIRIARFNHHTGVGEGETFWEWNRVC